MTLVDGAKTAIAVLVGLRAPRPDRRTTRRQVGLWTLVAFGLALAPLPRTLGLSLALACLPLARAQANTLWWYLMSARCTEGLSARIAPNSELVHKLLWALLLALDQSLVLGVQAIDTWLSAPLAFLAFLGPALLASSACVLERALGSVLCPRPGGWTWLGVQTSAAWEELIYRGLSCSVLWPLLEVPQGFVSARGLVFLMAGAAFFALPHYERGHPGGPRGVAITFTLGIACLLLGIGTGSILPGFLLHGALLGSFGVLRVRRLRALERGDLPRDGALFLLRLRHGYYVVDWEGDRIRRLAGSDDPLAARIRGLLAGAGDLVALDRSALGELGGDDHDRGQPGLTWLRRWGGFLVTASPVGSLPPQRFPSFSLRVLRALDRCRYPSRKFGPGPPAVPPSPA